MSDTFTRRELLQMQGKEMEAYLRHVKKYAKKVLGDLWEFARTNPTSYKYYHPFVETGDASHVRWRDFLVDVSTEVSLLLPDFRVSGVLADDFPQTKLTGYIIINWSTERAIK